MGAYSFSDIYNNEININTDKFDTIVFRDILENEFNLSSGRYQILFDDIRNNDINTYFYNLNYFIDSREDKFDKIPLDKLERTGSAYSVLMSNGNQVIWQRFAKPIVGTIRTSDVFDQSLIYYNTTINESNFVLDNISLSNYAFSTNVELGTAYTSTIFQDIGQSNWVEFDMSMASTIINYTDTVPEKSDYANGNVVLYTKNKSLDLIPEIYIVDNTNKIVKIDNIKNKTEIFKTADVRRTVAISRYEASVINSDGTISYWGYQDSTSFGPPDNVNFVAINAGYYLFVGVDEEGYLRVWGKNNTVTKTLISTLPTGNDFIDAGIGYNYGMSLKDDGTLVHWGSTAYVKPTVVPEKVSKLITSYKAAFVVGDSGYIYAIANTDFNKVVSKCPTNIKVKDIDSRYDTGVYLTVDGVVGQWGNLTSSHIIPNFNGKTIERVFATQKTLHAVADDGTLFSWGDFYVNVNAPTNVQVKDLTGYSYDAMLTTSDGDVYVYGSKYGSIYDLTILSNTPKNITAIVGGNVVGGYEYDVMLSEGVSHGDVKMITGSLYYTDVTDSVTLTDYIHIPISTISVNGNNIDIKYSTVDINTNRLRFMYKVNNRFESMYKLRIDLTMNSIGGI